MDAICRFSRPMLVVGLLVAVPGAALASDGVLEIHHACATTTGCFPGDTAGYPVTITGSGSHQLTSNLVVPNASTTAILIQQSDVTIDLGGFTISGGNVCSGTPLACTAVGTGDGVAVDLVNSREGVTLRNGEVRGMGRYGVLLGNRSTVERVKASHNGSRGFSLGYAVRVTDCVAFRNLQWGFTMSAGNVVATGCFAHQNGIDGFSGGQAVVLTNGEALSNGGNGIGLGPGSVVSHSTSTGNGAIGILVSTAGLVESSHASGNASAGIYAGSGGIVRDSTSTSNGTTGISVSSGSVERSSASMNGDDGIVGSAGSAIFDSLSESNGNAAGDDGIVAGVGSNVRGNTVRANFGFGLNLSSTTGYRENVITGNTGGGVTGTGTNLGNNLCAGAGVVSTACP